MSFVKLKDKKSGFIYVYESESYWDKEKKQPRNRRTLIGKLDEATGQIVPTRKKGQKNNSIPDTPDVAELKEQLAEKEKTIADLNAELETLRKEKADFVAQLKEFCKKWL